MTSFLQRILADSHHHEFVMTQNTQKDVVGIVTFDLPRLLPTNHIIILQWHTRVYEEMFDLNIKIP